MIDDPLQVSLLEFLFKGTAPIPARMHARLIAVLAKTPGTDGGRIQAEGQIIKQLEGRLAKFKCPKRVFIVEELPRNAMGKVQKAELRARYVGTFKS